MNGKIKVAHFTSFLPRLCGIATYAVALRKTMKDRYADMDDFVIAIDDNEKGYRYPTVVKYHFNDKDKKGYEKAAQIINDSNVDIVNIQHEFGLYGAPVNPETLGKNDGKNFLIFLRALKKPAVTTLHMVYRKPNPAHLELVKEICDRSMKIVVLSEVAKKILVKKYKVPEDKIIVIPHGAPNVPRYSSGFFKEMLGYSKKDTIISSFGFIRPKKGYEFLIDAMPEVLKVCPRAKLLIIGHRHPLRSPEYYKMLKDKATKLKLNSHIQFINKFVSFTDLINYLMATNIFVAPFLTEEQVSSGSLIYAMATGRACIATPFDYAKEVLAGRRGILIPIGNSEAIAKEIIHLIEHPKARHRMQNLSYHYARPQIWSRTARKYHQVFRDSVKGFKSAEKQSSKNKA